MYDLLFTSLPIQLISFELTNLDHDYFLKSVLKVLHQVIMLPPATSPCWSLAGEVSFRLFYHFTQVNPEQRSIDDV